MPRLARAVQRDALLLELRVQRGAQQLQLHAPRGLRVVQLALRELHPLLDAAHHVQHAVVARRTHKGARSRPATVQEPSTAVQ
jgi:hypothetical protein